MRIAYLDCFAGIAGDMLLGALVDAGVPRSVLEEATESLGLNASLRFETVDRSGITATKVHVFEGEKLAEVAESSEQVAPGVMTPQTQTQHQHRVHGGHGGAAHKEAEPHDHAGHKHVHGRSLTEITQLIGASALSQEVKALSLRAFNLLGEAEAKVHNVPVAQIHFHEVGSVDAIVDIVAASAGLVHLRVGAWHSSAINVGGGMVQCAHGTFPVPAPATALLLRGAPTFSAHIQKELVTPTGAALLRALEPVFGAQPPMIVEQIGYGAGTRNPPDFPNVLRLSIGTAAEGHANAKGEAVEKNVSATGETSASSYEEVTVLETSIDDATPQLLAYVSEQALRLGALDVMLIPAIMKKGRPGTLFSVLARPSEASVFEQLLLRETTTLGVRTRQERRLRVAREHTAVETPHGTVRVKTGSMDGNIVSATPEFEDCRRVAEESGTPLKQVQASAMAAFLPLRDR